MGQNHIVRYRKILSAARSFRNGYIFQPISVGASPLTDLKRKKVQLLNVVVCFFFFQALNFLVESFGLLNDLFPLPSILDAGYPVFLYSFGRCPV
jgi:hypothetical protein